jgi:MFS family permease
MSAPVESPVGLWRIAAPAYGPSALSSVGTGAVLPVLALTARDLGASVSVAALVVGLLGVGQFLTALPAGSLVARVGERRAMVAASLVETLAMVGALVSREVWQLAVAVLLLGSASAVFGLARQAYLTDAVPVGMRARALSTLGGVHRIGLFLGPLLGAAAIAVGGVRAAYAVGALAALAAGALVLGTRDLTAGHERTQVGQARLAVWSVLKSHRSTLLTLGTGVMVVAAARACRISLVPLWAEAIGLDAAQTSLVFAASGAVDMLLFYPAGSIMDRFGRAWIAVPSVVLLGLGMAALPLTSTLTGLTVVAMAMAVGNGMGSGLVMTLGADASPPQGRAQFLGGWRLFADFGSTAAPLVISGITVIGSLAAACVVMGGLSVLGGGWLARWVPRFDPRRGGPDHVAIRRASSRPGAVRRRRR